MTESMTRNNTSVNVESNARVGIFFPNFAKTVWEKWVRAKDPSTVVGETLTNVIIRPDTKLNLRICAQQAEHVWTFEILTVGKPLQNVALTLDGHRENFELKSVSTNKEHIGFCNRQEWYDPPTSVVTQAIKSAKYATSLSNATHYIVKVGFAAQHYGTFRQGILFGFENSHVVRKNICVDCIPTHDIARLNAASEYVLGQNPTRWTSDNHVIHPFESPFVPAKDPREEYLANIYPYPNKSNFFLTHATLTENGLTPNNYRGRLHELVSVEELARHEQVTRYNEVAQLRLSSYYIMSPDTVSASTAKYASPGELFAQLPLGRDLSEDTKSGRLLLRGCNSVLIKPLKKVRTQQHDIELPEVAFEAHVEDKCNRTIYVRLSKQCVEYLHLEVDTNFNAQVQFVLNRLPFCEWHRAIDCLPDTGLVFPDISLNVQVPWSPSQYWNTDLDQKLNPKQREAIMIMVAPPEIIIPPVLLLGPFGTGKTFTIAQGLRVVLQENRNSKILLCTQSNSAADLYVKDFFDSWYKSTMNPRLKPLRIYFKGRARNTVHPIVRDYCLTDQNARFRDPNKADILEHGLIITTLATSSCLTSLTVEFTHIVIDEAAQALECEALTALALATKKTRLVLAGDQMQLTPEVYSDLANERGLGLSLLERIHNTYPPAHPCKILLCQNYRAHSSIVRLTSDLFYSGAIEASSNLEAHPVLNPQTFYAVHGQEIQDLQSTGFYNDAETFEVGDRVAELKKFWPVEQWGPYGEGSIGVLAHYAEQVLRIRNELRKRKLSDVSVERVLNVQVPEHYTGTTTSDTPQSTR
ncbi:probable helicase with zinc finger domain isoform X2 [Cephus cinctus]|uniref:Probable helicase with zinc finger domain isoform X2 n=1 Tax=Cephus cinctus TaxID=211228 RepID=A0AAJ7FG10_CEPCN|nr:probable helicase with zinc finger domain isoform X2 [Cephus cinctus]